MADRLDMRNALNELAFRQSGYFTAAQARELGYSAQSQKYHADRGSWNRIEHGLYRLSGWPAHESDTYTRWFVWSDNRGVISHESAAAIHGIGDLDPRHVHLTLTKPRRTLRTGVQLHAAELPNIDIEDHDTFRVTTPERTLLDLADSPITQEQFTELTSDALDQSLADASELSARADDFGATAALRIERALGSYRSERT